MNPLPNPASLAPLFQSIRYCLNCQKPTQNWGKCKKCNSPAVIKIFAMVPVGGPFETAQKEKKDYKLMDPITTARQLRLSVIREFLQEGTITEEQALEVLAGPLEPGNLATVVDDSTLLHNPAAYTEIAADATADPFVLLTRSAVLEIIRAIEDGFDILTGALILARLKPLVKHDHAPAEFDGDGRFRCSICNEWIHKYQDEEV